MYEYHTLENSRLNLEEKKAKYGFFTNAIEHSQESSEKKIVNFDHDNLLEYKKSIAQNFSDACLHM